MMPAPRFFVPDPLEVGRSAVLPEAVSHHAVRVLRLQAGDPVVLFDGFGGEFHGVILSLGREVRVSVRSRNEEDRDPELSVTLAQVVPAGERMDWIVQKATELGVRSIIPLQSARSVVHLQGERAKRRVAHWTQVAVSACEQSGRNRTPDIQPVASLLSFFSQVGDSPGAPYILEPGATRRLRELAVPDRPLVLVVGPEGGFEDNELAAARVAGCQPLGLGPRILRSDTAGVAALAAMMAIWGDW